MDTSARAQERFSRLPWYKQLGFCLLVLGMLAVYAMHEAVGYFRREE
jgi:hypothetical protein